MVLGGAGVLPLNVFLVYIYSILIFLVVINHHHCFAGAVVGGGGVAKH